MSQSFEKILTGTYCNLEQSLKKNLLIIVICLFEFSRDFEAILKSAGKFNSLIFLAF